MARDEWEMFRLDICLGYFLWGRRINVKSFGVSDFRTIGLCFSVFFGRRLYRWWATVYSLVSRHGEVCFVSRSEMDAQGLCLDLQTLSEQWFWKLVLSDSRWTNFLLLLHSKWNWRDKDYSLKISCLNFGEIQRDLQVFKFWRAWSSI